MSDSGLDNTTSRTREQARSEIERKDRERWYAARKVTDGFAILSALDGREVALCTAEADRDFLLLASHTFHNMRQALEELLEQIDCLNGIEHSKDVEPYKAEACWDDALRRAQDALARAQKDKS